jgi:hypothetical protein
MNERIRQLAKQAILELEKDVKDGKKDWYHSTQSYNEMIQEKFAELIVRECQTVVDWAISVDSTIDRVPVLIKEHFGVEE